VDSPFQASKRHRSTTHSNNIETRRMAPIMTPRRKVNPTRLDSHHSRDHSHNPLMPALKTNLLMVLGNKASNPLAATFRLAWVYQRVLHSKG
jgi:hypothetical protein